MVNFDIAFINKLNSSVRRRPQMYIGGNNSCVDLHIFITGFIWGNEYITWDELGLGQSFTKFVEVNLSFEYDKNIFWWWANMIDRDYPDSGIEKFFKLWDQYLLENGVNLSTK